MSKRVSIAECYMQYAPRKRAKIESKTYDEAKEEIYERYHALYNGEKGRTNIERLIASAIEINTKACTIYDEVMPCYGGTLDATELQEIFTKCVPRGRTLTLADLIRSQVRGFRHILQFSSFVQRDDCPLINVQFILVWKQLA